MTTRISSLAEVASQYDAIVLDQWGVLHDGSMPYPGAVLILQELAERHLPLAILSNSGKRSAPNAARVAAMGFDQSPFHTVMTSGEALWQDIRAGRVPHRRFHAIERAAGDATVWAEGLNVDLVAAREAEALLLMGLPDGTVLQDCQGLLDAALARGVLVYCSNPDRASPRSGGPVISPGVLAFAYQQMGGSVRFYGKPHKPVFDAVAHALGTSRLLMVGDSLEHDIAGAQNAGWDTLFITGGLYATAFAAGSYSETLDQLIAEKGCKPPTFTLGTLS